MARAARGSGFGERAENGEGGVVVGLVGDLLHQLAVGYAAVAVDDDDGAGEEPGEGAVAEHHAELLGEEGRAEG